MTRSRLLFHRHFQSHCDLLTLPIPTSPAGIAVDRDGTIYFSDPSGHRLLKIDGCDGSTTPVPCIGGKNGNSTQFNTPRGLLIPKHRRALFVADSANHRIQIFDLDSLQLLGIWGQAGATAPQQPSSEPGFFNTPWTLAADAKGNIYIVDYGNKRVQKFDITGRVVPSFWENMQRTGVLSEPSDIAVSVAGETTYIYVLDRVAKRVFVFDTEGHPVRDAQGNHVAFGENILKNPMGIAATANAVYVGDNDPRRRMLTFKKKEKSFEFAGGAIGYHGPIAALALDHKGNLLVHTGTVAVSPDKTLAPIGLAISKAYRNKGILWTKTPIKPSNSKVSWHRLQTQIETLKDNAHLQFFVYTSNDENQPPVNPTSAYPFDDPRWRPLPLDVTDLFIGGDPARYLWIGAQLIGNGLATPVISQMRVEFDHETYLSHLPAIYSEDPICRDFLVRFLSLFESFFGEVESEIKNLSALFDPKAVPKEFLPWLATWLAIELDEHWSEQKQRQAIAEAFEMYARRGTVKGLRQTLHLFAGVDVVIEEPLMNAAWWSLPTDEKAPDTETQNSTLGFTTMLAPAEAQGAVVGTTAVLDQSHLITQEDFGVPLFEDVAHQFTVQTYRGKTYSEKKRDEIRALLDREKPAHTAYHLCVIEPRMRVGFQSRLGIDTVVAGPLSPVRLGETATSDRALVLGGEPPGRIGKESRVGKTTRLAETTVDH